MNDTIRVCNWCFEKLSQEEMMCEGSGIYPIHPDPCRSGVAEINKNRILKSMLEGSTKYIRLPYYGWIKKY